MAKKQATRKRTALTATEARKASRHGQRIATAAQNKQQAEAKVNATTESLRGRRHAALYFQDSVKPFIAEAASKGQHAVSIPVHSNPGENYNLTPFLTGLLAGLVKRLKGLGYSAASKAEYQKQFGSDDPYGNTTYFTLEISW